MNYPAVIDAIQTHAEAYEGWDFIVSTESYVNNYQSGTANPSSALVVLDPPRYRGVWANGTLTKTYDIIMAFSMHIEQDTSYEEKQAKVNIADQYATNFVHALYQNAQGVTNFSVSDMGNVEITPLYQFSFNSQHMAGVSLEFTLQTLDTFDYCEIPDRDIPEPILDYFEGFQRVDIDLTRWGQILLAIFAIDNDLSTLPTVYYERKKSDETVFTLAGSAFNNAQFDISGFDAGAYQVRAYVESALGTRSPLSDEITVTIQ